MDIPADPNSVTKPLQKIDLNQYIHEHNILIPESFSKSVKDSDLVDILCMIHAEMVKDDIAEEAFHKLCHDFALAMRDAKQFYRQDMSRFGSVLEIEHLNHTFHLKRRLRGGEGLLIKGIGNTGTASDQ